MKQVMHVSIVATCLVLCLGLYSSISAQWAPPTDVPPNANVDAPLNVGIELQRKNGPLQILLANMTNGFNIHTNPDWHAENGFSLDTDSPISAHGAFLTGTLASTGIYDSSFQSQNSDNVSVCADFQGKYVPCDSSSLLTGSFSILPIVTVSPTSIPENTPTDVNVNWSSSGALSCVGLQGDGFDTNGKKSGAITLKDITINPGNKEIITIGCTDVAGRVKFASTAIIATSVSNPPPGINFYISKPVVLPPGNVATASYSVDDSLVTQLSINPNGGGTIDCRKQVTGSRVIATNPWSGQDSGIWSNYVSIPPNTVDDVNTCKTLGVCSMGEIVEHAFNSTVNNSTAVLSIECKNSTGQNSSANVYIKLTQ